MPSKEPHTCPVCQRPGIVNLSQHLNGVHSICGQQRKRLIRGGLVATELMTREPQSNIEKHIVFLDMLQRGEVLRGELIRKARPEELKAILFFIIIIVMFEHERRKFNNAYKESTSYYRHNTGQQKYFIVQ